MRGIVGVGCREAWERQGLGNHLAGGPRGTPNSHNGGSRRLGGPSAVWYAGPLCAIVFSLPPGRRVQPICRGRVGWGSRGCVGTRGRGTEGDFDPELLACVNSCLPLFFWADSSSQSHLHPYCSSAKILFLAPPPIPRHSYYAPRCLFALLPPSAPAGAG